MSASRPTIGVLIRYKDHAEALVECLSGLDRQTIKPDLIVGIDSGSRDASGELLRARGARIERWEEPYHPSRVLNFAMERCPTDLVLVLSAHVSITDPTAIERMAQALADPSAACVACRWPAPIVFSERVTMAELERLGLRIGSIYSNAFGMLRRECWQAFPFDDRIDWIDDYAWAVQQLAHGRAAVQLDLPHRYQRSKPRPGHRSDFHRECMTMRLVSALAAKWRLRLVWLGVPTTAWRLLVSAVKIGVSFGRWSAARTEFRHQAARLWGRLTWRRHDPFNRLTSADPAVA